MLSLVRGSCSFLWMFSKNVLVGKQKGSGMKLWPWQLQKDKSDKTFPWL